VVLARDHIADAIIRFADHYRTMSTNSVFTSLPILNGPNYQEWAFKMKSYLMSQKQWLIVADKYPPKPDFPEKTVTGSDGKPKNVPNEDATPNNVDELKAWGETNYQALGSIQLRLTDSIGYKYRAEEVARNLWLILEKDYGSPGIAATYTEFKGAMATFIPEHADPTPALDKLAVHFARLRDQKCEIPEHLQAMIYLTKIPKSMDSVVQQICSADDPDALEVEKIRRAIVLAWERHSGRPQQPRMNKLSAVKRPQGQQTFRQQLSNQAGPSNQRQEEFVQQTRRTEQGGDWRGG